MQQLRTLALDLVILNWVLPAGVFKLSKLKFNLYNKERSLLQDYYEDQIRFYKQSSTVECSPRRIKIQSQPGLHTEILSQKTISSLA